MWSLRRAKGRTSCSPVVPIVIGLESTLLGLVCLLALVRCVVGILSIVDTIDEGLFAPEIACALEH